MKGKIMNFLKTIGSLTVLCCGLMLSVNATALTKNCSGAHSAANCKSFSTDTSRTSEEDLVNCSLCGNKCANGAVCSTSCPAQNLNNSCYKSVDAVITKSGQFNTGGPNYYSKTQCLNNVWQKTVCSTSCFWDANDDYYTVKISGKKHVASLNNPTSGLRTFPGDNKSYYYYTGKACSTKVEFKCSSGNFSITMPTKTTKVYRNCVRKNGDWDQSPAEWSAF